MNNLFLAKIKANMGDFALWMTNQIVAHLPSHWLRLLYYGFVMEYEIGLGSTIFMGAEFDARRGFKMGVKSVINQNCRLDTRGGIEIGDNVSISAEVCILTADHDLGATDCVGRSKSVRIEDFVFIGTRAIILPGVRLGRGSAVGAGAVVTRDVAPYTIVAGSPARKIAMRPQALQYNCEYIRPWH